MLGTIRILGVIITNEKRDYILKYLVDRLKTSARKTFIITPNPEMLVYAKKHLDYQDMLNHADVALSDGVGLLYASKFMGDKLAERVTGVDFIEELCRAAKENTMSMGFLGGRDGVAEAAAKRLKTRYPWIKVAFVGPEWDERKITVAKDHHNKQKIDILFVAFGVPKQEEWIYTNLSKLPVKAAMGVGGSFDFLSGTVPRAPIVLRKIGVEWLFRLIVQPWRWKRQLALFEFIYFIFRERFFR